MEFADMFVGSTFEEWLLFARLEGSKSVFGELGLYSIEDLKDVCTDAELVHQVRSGLSDVNFIKFKNAANRTPSLAQLKLCFDELQTQTVTSATSASSEQSTATVQSLNREIQLMQAHLEQLKASNAADCRVTELQRKIAEAQVTHSALERTASKSAPTITKRLWKSAKKRWALAGMQDKFRRAASLDICFGLDCTSSMGKYIAAARDHIHEVVDAVRDMYPDVPLRLGFVGYRDHCDGDKRLAVLRFTSDVSAFKTFVNAQPATGGGDAPEDVFGALSVVIGLDWQAATRLFFHIADAPCHGKVYHACDDSHPNGDPHGHKAEVLLPGLISKNVQYVFGRINKCTDQMISMFNNIARKSYLRMTNADPSGSYVTTIDVQSASSMMQLVSGSVTSSMYTSLSASATTDGVHEKVSVVLDSSIPQWPSIRPESINRFAMRLPTTLQDLIGDRVNLFVEPIPEIVEVKVGKAPFGAGAAKGAYKALLPTGEQVVHKIPLTKRSKDAVREKFEHRYISTHCAATLLAQEFMKVCPSHYGTIRYTSIALIQYLERDGTPYGTEESLLNGKYEKFNNNTGFVLGGNYDVVQAFSHWTYHFTGGKMMVVDCQGVYNRLENCFILTDPAIHCTDNTRFGGTNFGEAGMTRFFKSHKCNACCRALGLTPRTNA